MVVNPWHEAIVLHHTPSPPTMHAAALLGSQAKLMGLVPTMDQEVLRSLCMTGVPVGSGTHGEHLCHQWHLVQKRLPTVLSKMNPMALLYNSLST